ncbi:protein regulator of cytokinesis 1-like [Dermacentor silvarum]|uniref:protein regulator of cytokinesis 1-like n=1 Tax=Dermacentor silvarum TaxID=543639 RepID=UPI001897C8F9|nr:protein regulator of cytokinesis 1-like [Dermacentor silvarum]
MTSGWNMVDGSIDETLKVLEKENAMAESLKELRKQKKNRTRQLKTLHAERMELCAKLGMTDLNFYYDNGPIPTEEDLKELKQHVTELEREQEIRSRKVSALRNSIIAKVKLLDVQPEAELVMQLIEDQEGFSLTTQNIEEASAFLARLEKLEEGRRNELAILLHHQTLLHDWLEVPPEEQGRIPSAGSGLIPTRMAALKNKLAEYEHLNQLHLPQFYNKVKDEITMWCQKCDLPQNLVHPDDDCEGVTEERLSVLEEKLKIMKDLYSENEGIIAKVKAYKNFWNNYTELERHARDPSRLKNRGARLLIETRQRQRLQNKLTRLRKEIEDYIALYSGRNEMFPLWSAQFLAYLESQQHARAEEKQRECLERSKEKSSQSRARKLKQLHTTAMRETVEWDLQGAPIRDKQCHSRVQQPRRQDTWPPGGTPPPSNPHWNGFCSSCNSRPAALAEVPAVHYIDPSTVCARGKETAAISSSYRRKAASGRQLSAGKGIDEDSACTSTAGQVSEATAMDAFAERLLPHVHGAEHGTVKAKCVSQVFDKIVTTSS